MRFWMLTLGWGLLGIAGIGLGAFSALRSPLSALISLHSSLIYSQPPQAFQTKRCPKGHVNSADRKVCKECGANLPKTKLPARVTIKVCSQTGQSANNYCPVTKLKNLATTSVPRKCSSHKALPKNPVGVRITNNSAEDRSPSWGPNQMIAFVSKRDGTDEIYKMKSNGEGVVRLTNSSGGNYWPTWRPDGRITFVSFRDGSSEIYVMNADGSNQTRITTNAVDETSPSSGPFQQIVFESGREGNPEIFLMTANGEQSRLTNNAEFDIHPNFTKDGRIVFCSERDESYGIFIMNSDGNNINRLTNNVTGMDCFPCCGPDGRIAFISDISGTLEIYVMNSDGKNLIRITRNSSDESQLAWGPDGRIAYVSKRDGNSEIYLMKAPPK